MGAKLLPWTTRPPVPAAVWPGSLRHLTPLFCPYRQRWRQCLGQRLSVGLGKERRGPQSENEEQADDRGRQAIAAEADDQGAGDQRADAGNELRALKLNATAVARIRVGKSSGNQIGAQAQIPREKKPKMPTQNNSTRTSWAHR